MQNTDWHGAPDRSRARPDHWAHRAAAWAVLAASTAALATGAARLDWGGRAGELPALKVRVAALEAKQVASQAAVYAACRRAEVTGDWEAHTRAMVGLRDAHLTAAEAMELFAARVRLYELGGGPDPARASLPPVEAAAFAAAEGGSADVAAAAPAADH